jgi:hypothetical protein
MGSVIPIHYRNNDIIERMIEDDMKLSEKTKKELEERRKSKDFISHEEVKKRLGL